MNETIEYIVTRLLYTYTSSGMYMYMCILDKINFVRREVVLRKNKTTFDWGQGRVHYTILETNMDSFIPHLFRGVWNISLVLNCVKTAADQLIHTSQLLLRPVID